MLTHARAEDGSRPYRVLFARATASAGDRNDWTVRTGPKISSMTSREVEPTFHTRVGGMKNPSLSTPIISGW